MHKRTRKYMYMDAEKVVPTESLILWISFWLINSHKMKVNENLNLAFEQILRKGFLY